MFKPMLSARIPKGYDLNDLPYPLLGSYKYDGVRATVQHEQLLSRKLKLIPNTYVQELFSGQSALNGLDGELILGDPTADGVFHRTSGAVRRRDGCPQVKYYLFDRYDISSFTERMISLHQVFNKRKFFCRPFIEIVQQVEIKNYSELMVFETQALTLGYEGVMLRLPDSPYKQGRSTFRQGWLIKLKQFVDDEAQITGYEELMHNDNPAEVNELGKTKRSKHKENMVPMGTLGAFLVKDRKGREFNVGGGFTQEMRQDFWNRREALLGEWVKFKYQLYGTKDRPRTPIFLGFRSEDDM